MCLVSNPFNRRKLRFSDPAVSGVYWRYSSVLPAYSSESGFHRRNSDLMGRRRMKTNGDEKETHLAETTATYALGVFCQLVNPYISGVDHHKKGFMKDFFDAVLEDDGLRNPLPQHHRNRKPGKTTITTGVWSGINDTDLTRFYNGRKKIPAWKAAEFYQRLDISKVERLCCDISIDALADFQKELIKANIRVTDISELPSATGKWLLSILQANAGGRDILVDGISFQPNSIFSKTYLWRLVASTTANCTLGALRSPGRLIQFHRINQMIILKRHTSRRCKPPMPITCTSQSTVPTIFLRHVVLNTPSNVNIFTMRKECAGIYGML